MQEHQPRGTYKYTGSIGVPDNEGNVKSYPFSSEYVVGKPSATLSNVDLNVVYRGIDNKIQHFGTWYSG